MPKTKKDAAEAAQAEGKTYGGVDDRACGDEQVGAQATNEEASRDSEVTNA